MENLIRESIEKILLKKRGYVFKIPKRQNVVFLVSGGLDSIVSIDKVIREWDVKIHPLFIKRGAKAEKFEEQSFDYFTDFYSKRYPKNFLRPCKLNIENPPLKLKSSFPVKMLQTVGYPMRDAVLQSIGIQYAVSLKKRIKTIFTAMTPDETFPHCGILALRLQTLLACVDTEDWGWQITSPLTEPMIGRQLSKKDLILWAAKYDIPLEKTRTCISAKKIPDGICPECLWRKRAFKKAGLTDPLKYLSK